MLLVDTSVWVDYFNDHPSREAEQLAGALAADDPMVMLGLVATELLAGLRNDAEAGRIAGMLGAFDAVPAFTESDYRNAAGIYRKCRASGETVGSVVDCLIAQACLSHGYRLLSKDGDFRKIARNTPLRLVESA
jgi:predicted nucleic acid-binding protein